jgi:hypothetical protein
MLVTVTVAVLTLALALLAFDAAPPPHPARAMSPEQTTTAATLRRTGCPMTLSRPREAAPQIECAPGVLPPGAQPFKV